MVLITVFETISLSIITPFFLEDSMVKILQLSRMPINRKIAERVTKTRDSLPLIRGSSSIEVKANSDLKS